MKNITIEIPDDDVPRAIDALRCQAERARSLAKSCDELADRIEAQELKCDWSTTSESVFVRKEGATA